MRYYAASKMITVKTCSHGKDAYVKMKKRKQGKNLQNPKVSVPYDSSNEKLHRMNQDKQVLGRNQRLVELLMAHIYFQKFFGII